jgi:hypothetical protein
MTIVLDKIPDILPDADLIESFERNLFMSPNQADPTKAVIGVLGQEALSVVSQDLETFLVERSGNQTDPTPKELGVLAFKGEVLHDLSDTYLKDAAVEPDVGEKKRYVYSLEVDQAEFIKGILVNVAEERKQARSSQGKEDPDYDWLSNSNAPRPKQIATDRGGIAIYGFVDEHKVA